MNNYLLSIAIPTLDRADSLDKCLKSIVDQFDNELIEKIEVVVSDNASSDNTKEIVKKYVEQFSNINYFRHDKDVGYDANVKTILDKSSAIFCWTLNDNTTLEAGSIKYILDIIKNNKDVAYICVHQEDNKKLKQNEQRFANGNEWLDKIGLVGGRLSQCIYNKKYLPSDITEHLGNAWPHYSIVLEMIADRPALLVKNIFKTPEKPNECRWATGGLIKTAPTGKEEISETGYNINTYIYLKQIIENLVNYKYDKKIINKVVKGFANGLPRMVASAKLCGLEIRYSRFSFIVKEFYKYPFWLFVGLIVFFTPTFLIRIAKKLL